MRERYDRTVTDKEQRQTLLERFELKEKTRGSLEQTMMDKLKRKEDLKYGALEQEEQADLLVLETKKPEWNEELGAWTLNFR